MRNYIKGFLLSTSMLLMACGGGGGGSSAGSAAPIITAPPTNVSEGDTDFPSTISTDGLLAPDGTVTGTIDRTGDLDGFRLIIRQRMTIRVEINGNTLQESSIAITDDQGGAIAVAGQNLTSVNGQLTAVNPRPNEAIEITLDPGTYIVQAGVPLNSNATGTYTLSSSIIQMGGPDPDALTVTGTVSKGILANASVSLYAVLLDSTGSVVTLGETTTDAQGRYEVTISREEAGDAFYVTSTLSRATTVCDAPLGCGQTAFGDQFTYADDGVNPDAILLTPEETLRNGNILAAPVATPTTAATVNQNVNFVTTMIFSNIDIAQDGFGSSFAAVSVAQLEATERVTELFGIGGVGNIDIPFVDITQPFTSTDSQAIKAAILAGGLQSVMAEGVPDQVYSAFINDLFQNGGDFLIRESSPTNATISLEEIYLAGLEIEDVNFSSSSAYTTAIQSLRDDLTSIQAAEADSRTVNGAIP